MNEFSTKSTAELKAKPVTLSPQQNGGEGYNKRCVNVGLGVDEKRNTVLIE